MTTSAVRRNGPGDGDSTVARWKISRQLRIALIANYSIRPAAQYRRWND
jgi:hypothetical protein